MQTILNAIVNKSRPFYDGGELGADAVWSGPIVSNPFGVRLPTPNLSGSGSVGSALQPLLPFVRGLVTRQPALWFVGNRSPKPALVDKRVEVIFAECLAVFGPDEGLDFASLTRLLTELKYLHCDLAGNLAGDLAGRYPFRTRLIPLGNFILDSSSQRAQCY